MPADVTSRTLAAAAAATAEREPGIVLRPAEAEVDDARPVGGGVADRLGDAVRRPRPVLVEHLEDHQPRPRRDPDHAAAVLGRGDDPRDVGAVAPAVAQVVAGARGREVDAVDVVDVAVAVVVDAVARHLVEVGPDVRREVRVVEPRAGVDHGDDDARATRDLPRGREVEHGVGRHCPLLRAARVPDRAGRRGHRDADGGGGEEHGRAAVQKRGTARRHRRSWCARVSVALSTQRWQDLLSNESASDRRAAAHLDRGPSRAGNRFGAGQARRSGGLPE